ncbi:interleukin-6 receptor subunit beta-like [Seriola lalandi dorsalis]|uniref:interleukin-6 receptor subunit beta-like n=1 Tax=Seriola lalandi dorsalis TaxID=1841481 RepID=UPI000C6F5099|nr:interleukin-6 receptor subunit beta-like [Seriola lalandi dorsalis]
MERGRSVVWTCMLGAGLTLVLPPASSSTTSKSSHRPPQLIGCVFQNRANATCRWEAADMPTTNYTLQIQKMSGPEPFTTNSSLRTYKCTTSGTNCTANISVSSVRFIYCITVTAHGRSLNVSSDPRCQPGRIEVMLPPVTLNSVSPVDRKPECLNVTWSRTLAVFPVADFEIKGGKLNSQIEVTAVGQVNDVNVTDYSFLVCLSRPDTSYNVRLRHRYQGPASPWSPWSNALQGRTAEDAPSAAPAFWRQVNETGKNGSRLISLLWKPLPHSLANGKVLFYNVTCQTDSAQILNDHRSCRDLNQASLSCTLLLPAERCSCTLTASNSVGTSPEAQIRFLGATETEPPAPTQITASPLDDNNLDVSWMAPVDRSVSGFVVEWFAVREKSSSILHWERLNSSCTTLVITEGVKPMERYAVSVRALYGERVAGKNGTLHIYTRQGAPSAGPTVTVQEISGGRMELSWSPLPVEQLHGFLRNYTLHYTAANQKAKSDFVPGHVHRYSLGNLAPGNYNIFMQANTDAGAGAAGPIYKVHIGSEEISIVIHAVLPLMLTLLALVLIACLAQNEMVKKKLCQSIPDPSNSSLAYWTPITALESMEQHPVLEKPDIKYPEVILLGESELQISDLDQAFDLQTYSCHEYSPLPLSEPQTPQSSRISENRNPIRSKTTSGTDLSSCPYSSIVFSQTHKNPPSPVLLPTCQQFNDRQHRIVGISDVELQLGGDAEAFEGRRAGAPQEGRSTTKLDSPLSPADELKTFPLCLKKHQSLISLHDFSSISPSSVLLSRTAEPPSPKHLFLQSNLNSLLQPDTVTHPNAPSDDFTSFNPHIFVDFSYCPVGCDPHS